ncbi:MAG: imidazole glycerol phosphate synthase subunit HisH [Candidatus Omnitrophota bacterium]
MTIIVDYGAGNLRSVVNSALSLGKKVKVSDSLAIIEKAKKIILPGVGHFAEAVKELKKRKIFSILKKKIKEGTPFLGICIGMQLLLEESQEAEGVQGLGAIKGKVKRFKAKNLIVPHMGWNQVEIDHRSSILDPRRGRDLFMGIEDNNFFYFAHSYYCDLKEKQAILATTNYGINFVSALHKENIWGVQFHPEKSQKLGLKVFSNFLNL